MGSANKGGTPYVKMCPPLMPKWPPLCVARFPLMPSTAEFHRALKRHIYSSPRWSSSSELSDSVPGQASGRYHLSALTHHQGRSAGRQEPPHPKQLLCSLCPAQQEELFSCFHWGPGSSCALPEAAQAPAHSLNHTSA